jgi:hypothetical protein
MTYFLDDPGYLPGATILDKPPLPPIRSQQTQVFDASNQYSRSDSPQPFISNTARPKTGHPSNGSPSASTRRRLPKLAGAGALPSGGPPLFLNSISIQQTLPQVGEEDTIEIGSFPEEIPASITDQTSDVDTLDEAVVDVIQSEEVPQIEEDDLEISKDLVSDNVNEGDEEDGGRNGNGNDTLENDIASQTVFVEQEHSLKDSEDINPEENTSVQHNEEDRVSIVGDEDDDIDAKGNNGDVEDDNVSKGNTQLEEDNIDRHTETESNDVVGKQVMQDTLNQDQGINDDDDDNDVMSPNEVSREASAQSARSENMVSPIPTSPRDVSRLASAIVSSPKNLNSRSASRLSVNRSPRFPSATLSEKSVSRIKSAINASPKVAASSSRVSSVKISRASSRQGTTKLGIIINKLKVK